MPEIQCHELVIFLLLFSSMANDIFEMFHIIVSERVM